MSESLSEGGGSPGSTRLAPVAPHPEGRPEHRTRGCDPPHTHTDLHTPTRWTSNRHAVLNNADSPGDEASQDIIWDPMSPPHSHTGKGSRTTRVVKISDIVNRIAPQDRRPVESPLLQWIGDSAGSCTPEARSPRVRRRSARQSSVDGLMELARAFDRNMERSDALAAGRRHRGHPSPASSSSSTRPAAASESQQAEAELQALFDSSTQGAEGPLTPGCSQETGRPPSGRSITPAGPPGSGAVGVPGSEARGVAAPGPVQEFEDDWEDDDLLNDSLVFAMTQAAEPTPLPRATTSGVTARVDPSPPQGQSLRVPQPGGAPGEGGPRPKPPQRSTFKLEPNPRYPPAATHRSEPLPAATPAAMRSVTMAKPVTVTKPVTTVTPQSSKPLPVVGTRGGGGGGADSTGALSAAQSSGDLDCFWDEGGDDQLLFQVCEDVENLSNSEPTPAPQGLQPAARGYARSSSVPGARGDFASCQRGEVQVKGAGVRADQSALSRSHPGSHGPGGFQDRQRTGAGFQPQTVTARPLGNSKSQHATFKRHLSYPSTSSSKVVVSGQVTAQCTAAEIERKKQEALARKRQRLHRTQNPSARSARQAADSEASV